MAGAIFHLQHNTIGRKTHAAGSVRAHANYILRKSALTAFVAIGFSSHGHAFKREISAYEESVTRKNARLSDNIHFALPRCMTPEQHRAVALAFGWRLTDGGRARAGIAIHHGGGNNPHVHVLFVDKDRETGETVSKLSISPRDRRKLGLEPNATKWLRELWEDTCNRRLEEWGYEQRISCKPRERLLEEELSSDVIGPADGSPEVHTEGLPEGWINPAVTAEDRSLDDIDVVQSDAPSYALTDQLEEPAPEAQADHIVETDEMVSDRLPETDMTREEHLEAIRQELSEQEREDQRQLEQPGRIVAGNKPVSVAGKVKGSIELGKRGREVRAARSRLQTALDWNRSAEEAAATATVAYNQLEDDTERFNEYHRGAFGRGLAGINLFGFKLFGRKEAEAAQRRVQVGQRTYKALYEAHAEKARIAEREEAVTRADQQRIEGYASMNPEQRREALKGMAQAAEIIDQTQADTLKGVTGEQVYEAFKRGELTADEAQEACHWLGDRAHAARIAQEAEHEEEHELGM